MRELLLLDEGEQLKITALGLKMFERQDSKARPPAGPCYSTACGERERQISPIVFQQHKVYGPFIAPIEAAQEQYFLWPCSTLHLLWKMKLPLVVLQVLHSPQCCICVCIASGTNPTCICTLAGQQEQLPVQDCTGGPAAAAAGCDQAAAGAERSRHVAPAD